MSRSKEVFFKAPLTVANTMPAAQLPLYTRWLAVNVEGYPADEYRVTVYLEQGATPVGRPPNYLLRVVIDGPANPPPPPPWWRRAASRLHFRLLMIGWFRRLWSRGRS